MQLTSRVQLGSKMLEHKVELAPHESTNGLRTIQIGGQPIKANCEEIAPGVYSILLSGKTYEVCVSKRPADLAGVSNLYVVTVGQRQYSVELSDPRRWGRAGSSIDTDGPQEIVAPMPGKVVKILVTEGEEVHRDQGLLVMEAMKMQNEMRAARDGRIERVYVKEGSGVESGTRLLRLV
jgi:biotin carboxyl carrier protein